MSRVLRPHSHLSLCRRVTVPVMAKRSTVISFSLSIVFALAAAVLVFLTVCGFFSSWSGVVVATAVPIDGPRTAVWMMDDGAKDMVQRTLPTPALADRPLRVDPRGIPPVPMPPGLPSANKSRFTLHFIMTDVESKAQVHPTTSPTGLSLAVLVFFVILFVRNMFVAGSPFRIEARATQLPKPQTPAGQLAPTQRPRPKKGPPPPNKRRRR